MLYMPAVIETTAGIQTGPLATGTYLITNIRVHTHAVLAEDKTVVGDVRTNSDPESGRLRKMLWHVTALENGKYTIQNIRRDTPLYAVSQSKRKIGDIISRSKTKIGDIITASTSVQQCIITETARNGQYVYVIPIQVTPKYITNTTPSRPSPGSSTLIPRI
ncbi:hypothetical protein BD410DRAFT_120497 [Rickenella mellea]|uniref:Uncharacterized protein n=1 Tax=Rickenella mellea TaxID=50990 RepID=A0A4Y7PKU3_9AGAM|nr:hypothetical protein BD410DRAFT_120497 [Rickenella mellea]